MTCSGKTAMHDGLDVRVMTMPRDGFGRPEWDTPICSGCRSVYEAMGFELLPGREVSMPVFRERRRLPEKIVGGLVA